MLVGRGREREALYGLLAAVRAGESRALVIRGDAGTGKTALLEHAVEGAAGCRVVRTLSARSETELGFAGLQQLCAPLLDHLERLPAPQRDALERAFGMRSGESPDRLFVGLAVLGLLTAAAEERPLVCVVDDAQWLDPASAQALAFVARRLRAESVALILAVREDAAHGALSGLPELVVQGLADGDAAALLRAVIPGPLDERVRDRIVAETAGNPRALVELPRRASAARLAGGFGPPGALGLSHGIEDGVLRRVADLPADTRRLLLLGAAEPLGAPLVVWRAAERLGLAPTAAEPATDGGLIEFGPRLVRFRHPLIRSTVYEAASSEDRREAHRVLAEATDPDRDPDRRAWHRAHAVVGPDEDVAAELERSAGRAQARGGMPAAAAFLARAAELTSESGPRSERALCAAQAKLRAGALDAARSLLVIAQIGPLDDLQRARADRLRAHVALASGGHDGPRLLLDVARRLEPLDAVLARDTYLDALCAALLTDAGRSDCSAVEVAEAALAAWPAVHEPRAADQLLVGLALQLTRGDAAAARTLRRALRAFAAADPASVDGPGWASVACTAAATLWEHDLHRTIAERHTQLAREEGVPTALALVAPELAGARMRDGDLAQAASLIEQAGAAGEGPASRRVADAALALAAHEAREADVTAVVEARTANASPASSGLVVAQWAAALLCNGVGRYDDAFAASRTAAEHRRSGVSPARELVELIEAAARCERPAAARDALRQLSELARLSGTDWALGIEARSRALLTDGDDAEGLYREAIERLGASGARVDLARAHLVYGEWLGRTRRADAREQLRVAHEMLTVMGVRAFAGRAERELRAIGEHVRKRTVETLDDLTAQEKEIARLARDGLTNPEIGAQLFLSPRTIEWHLRKVFLKLDISSRGQLGRVLPVDADVAQAV
jgi:DNA-binding CsgD family transcriptional regulator